ncbi:helix-turn-helix domain-containing protein [Streptomyces griseorubiginosus]|uniref:helix-turn-helix domain-containing protein n=1 Tax=Streptomyces griseorubiginosus TaxID=67304 RepID=UPI003AF3716D
MTPEQLRTVGELRHLAVTGEARARRVSLHIGLRELARVIGVSPSALSRWENRINLPRGDHALRWANALGVLSTTEAGASPVYQPGESAGNDEAAGYQPAASVEQAHEPTQ